MRSAEDYVMVAMVITSLYGNLTHLARQSMGEQLKIAIGKSNGRQRETAEEEHCYGRLSEPF